jgi:hypothetical protein
MSWRMPSRLWWLLLLAVALGLGGCGSRGRPAPKRVPVNGTVTLNGQPMADGTIYFKTIGTGAVDGIEIKGGKFEGGAQTGDRRVEISQFREEGYINMGFGKIPNKVDKIPTRYNKKSTLKATVKDGGPNEFHFEVTSR